jgi:hypothetical protein
VTIEADLRRIDNPGISIIEDRDGIRRQRTSRGVFFSAKERAHRIDRRAS